jgi:hypothetical protein
MKMWIPACVGMTECGNSPNPSNRGGFEIPAFAGMTDGKRSREASVTFEWILVCVGMTECGNSPNPSNRGGFEIPAFAGMTGWMRSREASVTFN